MNFRLTNFGLSRFWLANLRLADLGLRDGGMGHSGPTGRFQMVPYRSPQDVHEDQFNNDDRNPEQPLPRHSHSLRGEGRSDVRQISAVSRGTGRKRSACMPRSLIFALEDRKSTRLNSS